MQRRTVLRGTSLAALSLLAGCLGDDDGEQTEKTDNARGTGDDVDLAVNDPTAPYVVEAPPGKFSAAGPLNTDLDGVLLHGYDPVAYFESETPVKGEEDYETTYRGATVRFESADHREVFDAAPEAYLPEFGAYCSQGVLNGYKDGMHPEAFALIDKNLYFNLTPGIHEFWLTDYEARINGAEENWPDIKYSTDPAHIGPGVAQSR